MGHDAIWLPLRDLSAAEVRSKLNLAVKGLRSEGRARNLVVDDLDALADPRPIEASLASLWRCQRELGGHLVLSSDRPLPARLAQAVELDSAREVQMQPLDRLEIEGFLRQSGCPSERVTTWGEILELSTLGHPQLVNARIAALEKVGFIEARAEDLLGNTPDVDRIRFEARRLIAELPTGPRELLYRASLLSGRVTRQHLMSIARIADAVSEPGDAIDVIAGPWLEATEDEAFRVSPLARGAAEEARGLVWVKSMHGQVAWTYLLQRTLTPWDISAILMHCYISGSSAPLAHLMQSLLSANDEVWTAISEACGFYTSLGLRTEDVLPFERTHDLYIFRILQYRIASEKDPELAMRLASKVDEEFENAPDDRASHFFRFLFLSQFLALTKVHYSMPVVISRAEEFRRLAAEMEKEFPDKMAEAGGALEAEISRSGYAQLVGFRLIGDIRDVGDIQRLVQALEIIPQESAREMLESIGNPENIWPYLIEQTWLSEDNNTQTDWPGYCETLLHAFELSARCGAHSMACAIAPVLIRTINENLGDANKAIETSIDLAKIVGDEPIFQCALAKVTCDSGDFPTALAIWKDALPRWPNPSQDIGAVFSYRIAGISSAQNDSWSEAVDFLDVARDLVDKGDRPEFALGLSMDAAFCRFMSGDRPAAVTGFGEVVSSLRPMQSKLCTEPLLSLQRRIGGILTAISDRNRTDTELKKLAGICSNPDPFITDASISPPLDLLRINLIDIELDHGGSLRCSFREAPHLRSSPFTAFRSTSAGPLFRLAQRTRDFTKIVADGLRQLDALAMASEQLANGSHDVMDHYDGRYRLWPVGAEELLIGNIIVALFDLAAAGELDRLPLTCSPEKSAV
ncbi:hypothetical protein CLG85_026135 [Yangia mangrovi]|uniref:Uncharacterized protein n=1 Tax=Alloyangia mangrovi TaxID=1779329 RepID=A0ABT2KTT5_9RHOB|nr:hypothetical protein [Alloyangia mangrovi]